MLDSKPYFESPSHTLESDEVSSALGTILTRPGVRRRGLLFLATAICAIFIAVAGAIVWFWGYPAERSNPGFWQFSLISILFWLSVSQGMVAVSAILRLSHASWRFALNRVGDTASLFGVWVFAILPYLVVARGRIYALGASEHSNNVWRTAGSMLFDSLAIGTAYMAGWMLLYLTSLPDFAALRDRLPLGTKKQRFYKKVALSWNGAARQWRTLRVAEGVMVFGVVITFVASQTIQGWDFQLASARNWDSSIFAPLYTIGSLLGGLALTTLVASVTEKVAKIPGLVTVKHYDSLGRFMIGLGLVWFYFRWCDYLTAWYGNIPQEWALQNNRVTAFPILAAIMVFGCFVAPVFANMFRFIRTSSAGLCTVSVMILIGLAVQRFLDTVPTFAPNYPLSALIPSFATILLFAGIACMFVLTYLVAARYFPVVSWWGLAKRNSRLQEAAMGNGSVEIMMEDPPIWET